MKSFDDLEEFKEGISEREAYIHSLYWVMLSSMHDKASASQAVNKVREFADRVYPND